MKALVLSASLAALIFTTACNKEPKSDLKSDKAKLGYAIGQQIGQNFKAQNIDVDLNALAMSISDVMAGRASVLTPDEMRQVMMKFQQSQMDKMKGAAEKNKAEGQAFLEKNKSADGVKTTKTGLQYQVLKSGKGATPKDKDTVVAHYRGTLLDGTEFDSSYKRGEPAEFPVQGVIPGWTEALKMMKVGDKWKLFVPSELAYGEGGRPGIPPNALLVFEVELLDIKKK